MPDTFQIINIKGSSIETKGNRDGKFVFRDALHFKVYHRRNHPVVRVVRKRRTRTTAGKARNRLTYDILGKPVDADTVVVGINRAA